MGQTKVHNRDLAALFAHICPEIDLQSGTEDLKYRRIMDVTVSPGRISSRFRHQPGVSTQLDLNFSVFDDWQWSRIILLCSTNSLFLATLLAGKIIDELTSALGEVGISLIPTEGNDVSISSTGDSPQTIRHLAALYWEMVDLIANQPFALFSLRGRGREEFLSELKMISSSAGLRQSERQKSKDKTGSSEDSITSAAGDMHQLFWTTGSAVKRLTFKLKADELPATLLHRLPPPPVGLLEDEAEHMLDELYDYITRRAQAYAIGLNSAS